mgnify:FL=1
MINILFVETEAVMLKISGILIYRKILEIDPVLSIDLESIADC